MLSKGVHPYDVLFGDGEFTAFVDEDERESQREEVRALQPA